MNFIDTAITRYLYYLKYVAEFKLHQRQSEEELKNIQFKRLKKMVNHAYENVPFYRKLFIDSGISPMDIKKLEDLNKIPIITKREIQANYNDIIARSSNLQNCRLTNTTGSTGIPLPVYNDRIAMFYSSALYYFAFFESGLKVTDRIIELTTILENEKQILRRKMISTYQPTDQIIQKLKDYNPDVIYSFPSVFKMLSHHVDPDNNSIKPRMVFTHGETLSDACRETIVSSFGTDVYNTYGATEFNRLAFECDQHSGLHMITDCAVMELVRSGGENGENGVETGETVGPGEEGEIVVTGLYNYVMPLIRYKLGDIGIMADYKCPCGRSWPLIKSIEGRSDDFLTLPSGSVISPRSINVIENIPGIIQYRTIQEKRDSFHVQVIPGTGYSADTNRQIEEQIRAGCLGEQIHINIELVEDLPRERTGKLKTIISYAK